MSKQVHCTHCNTEVQVGVRAMSIVCPHCNRRLRTEDIRIDRYYAVTELATTGNVTVTRRGHLVATVKAGNLTVQGRIQGHVVSPGHVIVHKTAAINGDIRAPWLRVDVGGTVNGYLDIGRDRPPAPDTSRETG